MIYALLTSVSSAISKVTPAPTPTATPVPAVFPDMWNFRDVNLIDILGLLFTFVLGIAAIFVSRSANKLMKSAEARESKLAVKDSLDKIYDFFYKTIIVDDYFDFSDRNKNWIKLNNIEEIERLAEFTFKKSTYYKIANQLKKLRLAIIGGVTPSIMEMKNQDGTTKMNIVSSEKYGTPAELEQRHVLLINIFNEIEKAFEEYKLEQ